MEKSFSQLVAEAKDIVPLLSPEKAHELMGAPDVVFVDPRPAEAIAKTTGLIPGARRVSLDEIRSGTLPAELADPGTRVITSCQAGPMGAVAAHEFSKRGFQNVHYIEGGTQGWLDAGYSTQR